VPKEHKVRIEVGYGLEGMLTDAASRVIIERDIVPNFRRGDFNAGILAGTTSMLRVLGGNPGPPTSPTEVANTVKPPSGLELAVIVLFFLIPLIGTLFLVLGFISSGNKFQWASSSGWDSSGGSSLGGGSSGGGGFSGGGGSFGGGGASGSW